jgi:hypothetical protein
VNQTGVSVKSSNKSSSFKKQGKDDFEFLNLIFSISEIDNTPSSDIETDMNEIFSEEELNEFISKYFNDKIQLIKNKTEFGSLNMQKHFGY